MGRSKGGAMPPKEVGRLHFGMVNCVSCPRIAANCEEASRNVCASSKRREFCAPFAREWAATRQPAGM